MKHILLFGATFLLTLALHAQSQRTIPYQAAARNAQGNPLLNQAIKVRFSLIDSAAAGPMVYQETHAATTNALGIFNLNIGSGTATSGSYDSIAWNSGKRYLKVELNPSGTGSTYIDLGTQPLLAVPYALYAEQSGSYLDMHVSDYGDTLFTGNGKWLIVPGISGANSSMFTNGYLTDIDGNSYKTVKIGNQTWMAENLRTSKFSDGTQISEFLISYNPYTASSANYNEMCNLVGYYHFDQNIINDLTMGKMYNYKVIESTKNVCPTGWHVPTKLDWTNLISNINSTYSGQGIKPLVDQTWNTDTSSNATGFSLKPSGSIGNFYNSMASIYATSDVIYPQMVLAPIYWSKTIFLTNICTGLNPIFRPELMFFDLTKLNDYSNAINYFAFTSDDSATVQNGNYWWFSSTNCYSAVYNYSTGIYENNPALALPVRCIKD